MNRPLPLVFAGLSLIAALIAGCGVNQRAAESLIDPQLRSAGVLVERQRGMRDLQLGSYRVEAIDLRDEPFDGSGPLGPDEAGRTRPTQQLRLSFRLVGGTRPWVGECVGQRRQPPDHDLAAVADELRDEVAVRCELAAGEQVRWVLRVDGPLKANLEGRLEPASDATKGAGKIVEVVMWYRLLNFTRRHLPASLALIRGDADAGMRTEAALILDKPERAWLEPNLSDAERELALTALLALRLLPLGFEG